MTRPSDRRLLRYARPARAYLAGLVVVTAAVAGLVILQAQLLATAIAGTFSGGLGLSALGGTIAALAAVVAGRAALAWAVEAFSYRASAGVKSQLRRDLLRRAVELGPRWLATRRAGELSALATAGVDALDAYFARYLPQVVLAVVVPLAVVARLLLADPLSAAIIVITLPLIPVFMALVGATTAERPAAGGGSWPGCRTTFSTWWRPADAAGVRPREGPGQVRRRGHRCLPSGHARDLAARVPFRAGA